jgi:uncharacterized repeat protein (TIGR03803 family)
MTFTSLRPNRCSRRFFVGILLLSLVASVSAATDKETTLHGFNILPNGAAPIGNMVSDAAGNLYGVASEGGDYGVIFELSPTKSGSWTETVIHTFTGSPDGSGPAANLIIDSKGNLYGATYRGGTYGNGAVFELSLSGKSWRETILHDFDFYDGAGPNGVTFDSAGNIFGSTQEGGSGYCYNYKNTNLGCGTVFELSPQSNGSWKETTLYNFLDDDTYGNEADPIGQLALDTSGNLYGATRGFSEYQSPAGEIFELSPSQSGGWTESVPYTFQNSNAGGPASLMFSSGNLYGTANGGSSDGAVVFELSPPAVSGGSWTETALYSFGYNTSSGYWPSSLITDGVGNFYGTMQLGGLDETSCTYYYSLGCGTIFELTPNGAGGWNETTLYQFTDGSDGANPQGIYRDSSGALYTTELGGSVCNDGSSISGCGAILELSLTKGTWTPTVLYDFPLVNDGLEPLGGLVADSMGNYYGTTVGGGTYNGGTIFELSRNSKGVWQSTILYNFGSYTYDGTSPYAGVIFDSSGNLYGTTWRGGTLGGGTVFELSPAGSGAWTEKILYSFPSILSGAYNASQPTTSLVFDSSGNLYGTSYGGESPEYCGTAYELSPSSSGTWSESLIHSFCGNGGNDGSFPTGPLIVDKSGNLYGVTHQGNDAGQYLNGTVYELSPPTTSGGSWTETLLLTFPYTDTTIGVYPSGALVFDSQGNLYGTTSQGGEYNSGIVYKLAPSGSTWTESVLYSFKGVDNDGGNPEAGLVLDSEGNLYGTTAGGGTFSLSCYDGCGTVFKLTDSGGKWQESVLYRFAAGLDGAEPSAPVILDSEGNVYGTTPYAGSGAGGTVFMIEP